MNYIIGGFYIFVALIVMLWSLLSEFGGVNSIIDENPNGSIRLLVMYGKVLILYPFMAYLSFKLMRNGIKKFSSPDRPDTTSGS